MCIRDSAKSVSHHSGREKIIGMIALDTLGCYSPRVHTKRQSAVVAGLAGMPDRCDYVAFLSTNPCLLYTSRCV